MSSLHKFEPPRKNYIKNRGTVLLSNSAQIAIKNIIISDERLIEILNSNTDHYEASRQVQRWMAAQILGQYGYSFALDKDSK